jgi:hypothetical protein
MAVWLLQQLWRVVRALAALAIVVNGCRSHGRLTVEAEDYATSVTGLDLDLCGQICLDRYIWDRFCRQSDFLKACLSYV